MEEHIATGNVFDVSLSDLEGLDEFVAATVTPISSISTCKQAESSDMERRAGSAERARGITPAVKRAAVRSRSENEENSKLIEPEPAAVVGFSSCSFVGGLFGFRPG